MNLEEALEQHRYINVDSDWWDSEYEFFIGKMEDRGITILEGGIKFSGFYSQGDGASFTGYIHRTDLARFMEHHKLSERYAPTYYLAKKEEIDIRLVRSHSLYCHENTITIDIEDQGSPLLEERGSDDVRQVVYCAMYEQHLLEVSSFEEEVLKICRNYMRQLFSELEDQFEYLTSDEAVLEALEMNDLYTPQHLTS